MKMLTREAAEVRTAEGVQPSRMWFSDLIFEAFAGIFARPGRMFMTILGTMIGLTALVATLGLSRTANAQIISRFDEPGHRSEFKLPVEAASPELFTAVRARVRSGRLPDEGHSQRADKVAVLGPNAAEQLGISGVANLESISIGDEVFLVIGILEGVERKHTLLSSVIIRSEE